MQHTASIIVPVYNLAKEGMVAFCMEALLSQTFPESYQIIAVDDCSSDGSFSILKEYEKKASEINPLADLVALKTPKRSLQGAAKNLGLTRADGEWIGFIDGDDWVSPCFLEKLIALARAEGSDLAGCNLQLVWEHGYVASDVAAFSGVSDGRKNGSALSEITRVSPVQSNQPEQEGALDHQKYASLILDSGSLCTKLYHRHIIFDYENRFPEGIFYEDNAIANSWMLRAKKFSYLPEPLYYYYQHSNSTVHTVTKERCLNRMEAARILLQEAKEFGFLEEYKAEIEASFTTLFYVNTLFSYVRGAGKVEREFVQALGEEMLKTFPAFRENPYYEKRTDAEERRLIDMQLKNTSFFLLYDKLLQTWRKMRKR